MLKKRIIPILLLKNNVLIKDQRFRKERAIGSALPIVKLFNLRQVDELIFLDVQATTNACEPDYTLIREISKFCFVPLTVGGGINRLDHIKQVLNAGADKISLNSIAYTSPSFVREAVLMFGSQCIVLSIDVKKINNEYICFSHSGTVRTCYELTEWLKIVNTMDVGEILITSIDKDGTMQGYDIELINITKNNTNIPIIASGGCASYEDMLKVFNETDISAAAAASIYQFTNLTPNGAKNYLEEHGVRVRSIFR